MKVKLLEPIEGFEEVAEWRHPKQGEYFFSGVEKKPTVACFSFKTDYQLVLTQIRRWRPATIDDAVRAIKGEMVVARFWDSRDSEWLEGYLIGYRNTANPEWLTRCNKYRKCEVLDA